MLTSPQLALGLCDMCIAHARMPEPCLVLTPSCFVCGHDVLNRCACVFGTHPCVNLLLVFSVRSCILYVCLICIKITFAFRIAACLCVSIINGAAKYSHHTHFYSLSLELCVL